MSGNELAIAIVASVLVYKLLHTFMTLRYRNDRKEQKFQRREANVDLEQLSQTALSLEQRINTLESILDQDAPGWRTRHDRL
ncbi:MAG: hypothetical protein HRU19_24645 [Pseudobacteriovorax sp.]|nr:hypothetical protein [Pseudobacteriovorax sp.]